MTCDGPGSEVTVWAAAMRCARLGLEALLLVFITRVSYGAAAPAYRRFGTRRLKPSVQDLNLVTKCKWTMGCPRYELGMLSMASKTLLIMLERFPQLSGW